MKKITLFFASIFFLAACNKTADNGITTPSEIISPVDSIATTAMRSDLNGMGNSLDSLMATPHYTHQLHWDSLYHHHDSMFWYHHNLFHHDHYTHDDHHHSWTNYDPHIDHSHHYHHPFPGHDHDSLVTTHNGHEHDNNDHHYTGHDLHDHQILDSLHHLHGFHHP